MKRLLPTFVLAMTAVILCAPESAWAWGPGTHLKYAEIVMLNRLHLPELVADLIARFPGPYYYGNIIADLVLGKKYRIAPEEHSHNWEVAFDLMDEAKTDEQQATMWGYLAHLAADVVAHNVYIPTQIVLSAPGRGRGHAFWEMHYDAHVPERYLHAAMHVQRVERHGVDDFLMEGISETIFSHRTNRRIFSGALVLQRLKAYRNFARRSTQRSPFRLPMHMVNHYDDLSLNLIFDVLRHGPEARALNWDPNGHERLERATQRRENLRNAPGPTESGSPKQVYAEFEAGIETVPPHPFEQRPEFRRDAGQGDLYPDPTQKEM